MNVQSMAFLTATVHCLYLPSAVQGANLSALLAASLVFYLRGGCLTGTSMSIRTTAATTFITPMKRERGHWKDPLRYCPAD